MNANVLRVFGVGFLLIGALGAIATHGGGPWIITTPMGVFFLLYAKAASGSERPGD